MDRANHLLAALTAERRAEAVALGTVKPLQRRVTLVEAGEPLTHLYFPLSGAISLLTVMLDGESVEAGVIGREGMLGPVGPLAERALPWRAVVQMPGQALTIPVAGLATHPALVAELEPLEWRFRASLHWFATLSIACNRFHSLDQRCARWLLMLHDRADDETLSITHEFLAEMLGARRQSVTRALNDLALEGLILRPHRSEVRVADRRGLERAACECYERMRDVQGADAERGRRAGTPAD